MQERGYKVWLDVHNLKGSTLDAVIPKRFPFIPLQYWPFTPELRWA